jgi:hypothetical protein
LSNCFVSFACVLTLVLHLIQVTNVELNWKLLIIH